MSGLLAPINNFVNQYLHIPKGLSTKIVTTLFIIIIWQLILFFLRSTIRSQIKDPTRRYIASKSSVYITRLIVFVVFINIWVGMGGELLAYLGLLSAGIAIALQEPIANFAGWVFIMFGKPFNVGDRIEINNIRGDVIDVRPSQTSILEIGNWVNADQSSGRVIHIPNGWFLKNPLANYTQRFDFIWNEIPVTITFESNWRRAKMILERLISEHPFVSEEEAKKSIHDASSDYFIYFNQFTPIVYTTVDAHGVTLTVRYICRPKQRRASTHKLWEAVLVSFEKEQAIDFAYPTQRIYMPESTKTPPAPFTL